MNSLFGQRTNCNMIFLVENVDPHGAHMDYRDDQGVVFAKLAKVYKHGWLAGFFSSDHTVYGEMKDMEGNILLTLTSHPGATDRDRKVEVFDVNKKLLGVAYDAHFGVDFELPDGTLLGRARRDAELKMQPRDLIHTFTDASDQVVGTGARRYPNPNDTLLDNLFLSNNLGMPMHFVNLEAPVDPVLHTFLFLFPALQRLRFSSQSW